MAEPFEDQLKAAFEQQQALLKAWVESLTPQATTLTPDKARAAAAMASQSEAFIALGEALQQNSATLKELFDTFIHQIEQSSLNGLIEQWQISKPLQLLIQWAGLLEHSPFTAWTPEHTLHQHLHQASQQLRHYQQALQQMATRYQQISQQAGQRLWTHLNDPEHPTPGSLQALHDLWVDDYEYTYAAALSQLAYQQDLAQLQNSFTALQHNLNQVRDRWFESLGLATQRSLAGALSRQQRLAKELRALKNAPSSPAASQLHALELRMQTLEQQLGQHLQQFQIPQVQTQQVQTQQAQIKQTPIEQVPIQPAQSGAE